jgi:tetratricopeptide (TPR) repeat protein
MRLLHFDPPLHSDAPSKLISTDFRGKSIPPYAILSHRWSDSEALFEDVSNGTYKGKKEGYRKLMFSAEQAAQDKLQYFWIDTCCINKWDKDGLSRAINSMFQWYQNAARCYVFLSDLSLSDMMETAACSDWEASFRKSTWFTRGWTLQELIAPVTVEFFSDEGRRIGDKSSLGPLLHDITGIPLEALRNCSLKQFSTSERMRWFGDRTTTEEEDSVYCLLGLLGVSIPATYGEGKESARWRLQTELDAAGNAPSIIPFSQNQSFVGREVQLTELEARLFSNDQTTTTLAIFGPGGTGKSQLALEVAHRTRLNNKNCSVFWIDASDTDSLYRSYASVVRKLRVPGCDDDQVDMKQVVKRCVAEVNKRHCLLVLDNVESTTLRASSSSTTRAADLADFLPHSKLCSVIFTTTESDTAETLAPQNVTALHELTPDTALRMLQNCLMTPLSNAEQQEAMHLLRELLYLPLAVVQAAACMNASSMAVQQYQAQLDRHKEAALKYSDVSPEGEQRESCLRKIIAATLFLSISQVRQNNATAAEHLYFAACVDRKDIPLNLLKATSPQACEDAIKILDRYALVTRRPAESAFDVHRLVHQALREQLQVQGQLYEYTQRTVTQLLQVFPNRDHSNRSKWRRLLPHAQYALSHSEKNDDEEVTDLAEDCARALKSDGQYNRAEELFLQVTESRSRVLGSKHPDTLTSVSNLGSVLSSQGKYKEAEAMHRRALEAREKMLGREHPDTLTSVSKLGLVLLSQGKYQEAEAMHRRDLEGCEKVLGREHPDTLTSVSNLGSVLLSQGKYQEAEAMHRRALEAREKVLGREDPDTLTSVGSLGSVLSSQGKYKEAEAMHRRVLEAREKMLGREHPHTLISVGSLGSVLSRQGKYEEAEAMHRRALEGSEKVLGREHPDTLISVSKLGSVLSSQGKYQEAEAMHRRALEAREKVLGREHPYTLTSVSNLGSVLSSQGKYKEAEAMHRQALEAREKVLRREDPDTLASVDNLGLVLERQGKYEEAEAMHRRALEAREKVLGREDPNTLASVDNLGLVLSSQGKYEEAERMHRRALEGYEKAVGREHPDTLISVNNLRWVLSRQGKYEEAEAMHRRDLEGSEKVLGREHPDTLTSVSNLGSVLERQGKYEEAEAMHRRALEGCKKVLGREHPDTLISVSKLGSVLSRQGKYQEAEAMHRRALEAREKVLGLEHPNTLTSVYHLAYLLAKLCDYKESLDLYNRACSGYSVVLGERHPTTQACCQHRSEVLALQE